MGAVAQSGLNLEALYAAELRCIYSFLHRLGARGTDLEDLAHDVFVTALRRWSAFDPSRPVRPWLLGIAFRVMADFRRKGSSSREIADGSVEQSQAPSLQESAEDRVDRREKQELIQEALESLEPDRRAVFVMFELEGISAADISESLGTPVATTYSRLRVGREEFTAAVRRIQLRRGES
jgi:RNA polymerase sigma-70 factor (ECF subfamily)